MLSNSKKLWDLEIKILVQQGIIDRARLRYDVTKDKRERWEISELIWDYQGRMSNSKTELATLQHYAAQQEGK